MRLTGFLCLDSDTVGKLTIGVGRNLDDVGISESEAETMLRSDIARSESDLDRTQPFWRTLNDARQEALANMCFNMGITRLLKFRRMWGALMANDFNTAADEALDSRWARQVGARADELAEQIRTGIA